MNRLSGQKSPYLLQHASNPVDWYPWGDEAFMRAVREDRPVFLSIGYSTCHWCHVMERECFSDREVAALMNDAFVSIKVDREERPDLDEHFMMISQMLTGSGGWPLTIVMTPDRRPFFAATYLPKKTSSGRLGMLELVPRIRDVWMTRRAEVLGSADSIRREIGTIDASADTGFVPDADALRDGARALAGIYDSRNGGFSSAPKFPMPTLVLFLLRAWKRDGDPETLRMAERTLVAMRNGGIFDQVGFGFHRYSTDDRWLVPHFEKMLYDQALLALAYTEAWQATGRDFHRRTAEEILSYVQRDLSLPEGGFATAEDADSEGEEGRFYLWTTAEIRSVLPDSAFDDFKVRYSVRDEGNFGDSGTAASGANILHRAPSDEAPAGEPEAMLLAARAKRVRPPRDDKILADWNGLMIAAFARAGSVFDEPALLRVAQKAARFILTTMRAVDGRLLHRFRDGEAAIAGFADDHAFLSWGLLELFEATFEVAYLEQAIALTDSLIAHFWDGDAGGFFQTADDSSDDIGRRKSLTDDVVPSANSVGLLTLLKLNRITGNPEYQRKAEDIVRAYPPNAATEPVSHSFLLSAADFLVGPSFEVVISGDPGASDTREMLRVLRRRFTPNAVVLQRSSGPSGASLARIASYTASMMEANGRATAYVCRDFSCNLPTNEISTMLGQLGERNR